MRVIDLSQMLVGPNGGVMPAEHGADVIKIESPEGGTRPGSPLREDGLLPTLGGYYQGVNRNKRSCLDLKKPDGREALLALIKSADAPVENFRASVMDRIGLGHETLRQVSPRLVYGAQRGFGDRRTGAWTHTVRTGDEYRINFRRPALSGARNDCQSRTTRLGSYPSCGCSDRDDEDAPRPRSARPVARRRCTRMPVRGRLDEAAVQHLIEIRAVIAADE